jgi:hypothetical protein
MWLFCLIVDVGLSVICLTFSDYGHICLTIVTVLGMPTICLKVGAKSDEFRAPDPETTNCLTIKRKSDKKPSRWRIIYVIVQIRYLGEKSKRAFLRFFGHLENSFPMGRKKVAKFTNHHADYYCYRKPRFFFILNTNFVDRSQEPETRIVQRRIDEGK